MTEPVARHWPLSVVSDVEDELFRQVLKGDGGAGGPSVLEDVGEAFLDDAVGRQLKSMRQVYRLSLDAGFDRQPRSAQVVDQAVEGGDVVPRQVGGRAAGEESRRAQDTGPQRRWTRGQCTYVERAVGGGGAAGQVDREGVELRAHVETVGVVSAALLKFNSYYFAFVDPGTGHAYRTHAQAADATPPAAVLRSPPAGADVSTAHRPAQRPSSTTSGGTPSGTRPSCAAPTRGGAPCPVSHAATPTSAAPPMVPPEEASQPTTARATATTRPQAATASAASSADTTSGRAGPSWRDAEAPPQDCGLDGRRRWVTADIRPTLDQHARPPGRDTRIRSRTVEAAVKAAVDGRPPTRPRAIAPAPDEVLT